MRWKKVTTYGCTVCHQTVELFEGEAPEDRWSTCPKCGEALEFPAEVVRLVFIIQGQDVPVVIATYATLRMAVEVALSQCGIPGLHHPVDAWEVRYREGLPLLDSQTLRVWGFVDGTRLTLTLKKSVATSGAAAQTLLPCPFCGAEADDNDVDGVHPATGPRMDVDLAYSEDLECNVYCGNCGAVGPVKGDVDVAIAAWNQRVK